MNRRRSESAEELIYEIRKHAAGVLAPDLSQQEGSSWPRSGLRSYLSVQGVKQLKQKWSEYRRPRRSKRKMALFVSPYGEHVAVAVGNQVVILQRDDDYLDPCGIYISNDRLSLFTNGAWMEPQGILGVMDDMSTLYLINSNGGEITKRTRSELKLTASIVDLIVLDDVNFKKSSMSVFGIFTADGLIHSIEVTKEPRACICSIPTSNNPFRERSPNNISCLDFHPDLSLAVLVDAFNVSEDPKFSSGFYCLYLLRMAVNSGFELVFCSPQFEGLFSSTKDNLYVTSPKVSFSPHGKYIATLDLTGSLDVFSIGSDKSSLSMLCFAERLHLHVSDNVMQGRKNDLKDIVDISWWTDHVLVLANSNGSLIMYDFLSDVTILKDGPHICMPVMERTKHSQELVFVLEGKSCGGGQSEPEQIGSKTSSNRNQLDDAKLHWSLLSICSKSVTEMYGILICNQQYHAALDFADQHDLDRDEVFKAQWLSSCYGAQDVDLFLSKISDRMFVLSECVDKVGPTEDAVKSLLNYGIHATEEYLFSDLNSEESCLVWDFRVARLQLLQYKDKLDTFIGINMGRFLAKDYTDFRVVPVTEAAMTLAESGKIGALNLLFKRHPYSLSPDFLNVLSAIPETVPVQSYGQLLPGRSPPSTIALRERDWVEDERMILFIDKMPGGSGKHICVRTENIMKQAIGFVWPSITELVDWYINRAKDIDVLSGQLGNCLALVNLACRKGIVELQHFLEDIMCLNQLIYADGCTEDFIMGLHEWEQLSDYEKFKMLLKGVTAESAVEILQEKAIPFMQKRFHFEQTNFMGQMNNEIDIMHHEQSCSFLVRWMKELAAGNKLNVCLKVIENGCGEYPHSGLFKDEMEIIETALECIYSCTLTDQWHVMSSILSKLPCKTLREKTLKDTNQKHGSMGSRTPRFSYIRTHLSKSSRQSSPLHLHEEDSGQQSSSGGIDLVDVTDNNLEKRIKIAEGHVEVGRLLAYYQVPKPIGFFIGADSDEKNVKQLLRLILSKFGRRQPGRSDSDWASMWHDMQCFQEKAFPFLDTEYMLIEFCRGLLKAGKFSLARNYLKGTGTIALETEKAEILVVQAAREYFFSASSLSCSEIWKARECLSLFPNSKVVQSEADVIEALTVRLPNLGVTLLPVQFRQIRNPLEIINMVISSQTGAYLNVEELIEVAKLLGLGSPDDIATVEEAIAREAAVIGDLQLASDLCLVLSEKGHGSIWDLCAAIARGPHIDNMDTSSRKKLLGFALSHCDEESIGELLHAWKDVDILMHYEQLMLSTKTCPVNFSFQGSKIISLTINSLQDIVNLRDTSEPINSALKEDGENIQVHFDNLKSTISGVAECSTDGGISWDSLLKENKKVLSFAALELPWLLELSSKEEYGKKEISGAKAPPGKHSISVKFRALINILHWLAENDIAPRDELLISLAKSIMVSPVTEEDDILGCALLLNLLDAFHGVEVIEEQLNKRGTYKEIHSIMNMGMSYSSIQNSNKECCSPDQRRELLLHKFREKYTPFDSEEVEQIDKVHSTFWREWKTKLEDQRCMADQARALEETVPGVDADRFLSGDIEYIRGVVFSLIDSVKTHKKHILKEAVKLANMYGLQSMEVLLRFFGCALVSEQWENDDILTEISEYREDIVNCPKDVIEMISTCVFPEINGHNKQRLSYVYSILAACHLRWSKMEETSLPPSQCHQVHKHVEPFRFYKALEQECKRVSFIKELDFKNIARLHELNYDNFNEEILNNIHESTVEVLADMVHNLAGMYSDTNEKGLISWQDVYKHHVLSMLSSLESRTREFFNDRTLEELQVLFGEVDLSYGLSKKYIMALPEVDRLHIMKRYQKLSIPCIASWSLTDDPGWKHCLTMVLDFWIKLVEDIQVTECNEASYEKPDFFNEESMSRFLKTFKKLVMEDQISSSVGWFTLMNYVSVLADNPSFFKSMIFSGCRFSSVADVYFEAHLLSASSNADAKQKNLVDLYVSLVEIALPSISHHNSAEHQNLHRLLSSLSKMEGSYVEDLKVVRSEVWRKLSALSDNLQLESSIKVYALELMQCITGQNYRSLPDELISDVLPWEDWDESCQSKTITTAQGTDGFSNITTSLVALKSNRLIAAILPNFKFAPEDLVTANSAVTCFLNLCEALTSPADVDVLEAVLEEWEVLFPSTTVEEEATDSPKIQSEWNNDDWDEGWETLPDDELIDDVGGKEKQSPSIHPLHACWMQIVKMLIGHSRTSSILELLDRTSLKPDGLLLDEDEAKSLFHMLVEIDYYMALKFLLLLPYDAPRLQCLQAIESKLKERGVPENCNAADQYELLILVLSSGIMQSIIFDPALGNFFSYMCYLAGHLARICQEDLLKCKDSKTGGTHRDRCLLFGRLLLPCFISELVQAKQCILAGVIVSQWMHTHPSLGLIDIVEASLRKYLECQLLQSGDPANGDLDVCRSLHCTLSRLRAKSLGLPYLSAYLNSIGANFSHGANFATAGSTIRRQNTTLFQDGFSPFSLDVQTWQFSQLKSRSQFFYTQGGIFKDLLPRGEYFSKALYTFDIGQNDLTAGYFHGMTTDEVKTSIPDILNQFTIAIKSVYGQGGRYFWIHNTGPFGCLPYVLDRLTLRAPEVDHAGCGTPFNGVAQLFNSMLNATVSELRQELTLASFTYVDVYSNKYKLISQARKYGFEHPLVACCGHGGVYNYDRYIGCGAKAVINGTEVVLGNSCKEPIKRVNWDGVHYTEAANKWVFDQISEGAFSDPPLPIRMACCKEAP